MLNGMLDFRSDTVTQPTRQMRAAMAEATVGDDVFGEDPTVNRLEQQVAEILGKEAALFVPSGTMSNLIAVRTLCRPGDEMICEVDSHIYNYEQGGYAQLCGVAVRTIQGRYGVMGPDQLRDVVRPDNAHLVRTRLLTVENTHNRGGGKLQPLDTVTALCQWARQNGLKTHLDGARLFNAVVATGIEPARWAAGFDTVNVCFSKGLGAPVGSALAGSRELIARARRHRKVLGGGMRQAGVLAAAALYALEHHVDRLAEDHANAQRLARGLRQIDHLQLDPDQIDTNILFFRVDPVLGTAEQFCRQLARGGLLMLPTGPQRVRAVTHLNVTADDVDRAVAVLKDAVRATIGQ